MKDVEVVQEIVLQLEKELEALKTSVKHSIIASQEAPSRMEARYDTRKEDMARFAEAQDQIVLNLERLIAELKSGGGKLIQKYLLVSTGGGKKFVTKQGTITLVSAESPIGKRLSEGKGV